MIINHNCFINLVPLVIFIYDARSHIHQNLYSRLFKVHIYVMRTMTKQKTAAIVVKVSLFPVTIKTINLSQR